MNKNCPHCKKKLKPPTELPKLGDIVYPQGYHFPSPHWRAEIMYIAPSPNTRKVRGKHRVMLRYLDTEDFFIGTLEYCRKVEEIENEE